MTLYRAEYEYYDTETAFPRDGVMTEPAFPRDELPEETIDDFIRDVIRNDPTFYDDLAAKRVNLHSNEYEPTPIDGKAGGVVGFTTGEMTVDRIITETKSYKRLLNTGLRCGRLVPFDIDLYDDDHTAIIAALIAERLGYTPLLRRGSKGMVMLYRVDGDNDFQSKTAISGWSPTSPPEDNAGALVEVLGRGFQVAAFGIHPKTGRDYEWVGEGNPLTVPFSELPTITIDAIMAVVAEIRERLTDLCYRLREKPVFSDRPITIAANDDDDDDSPKKIRLAVEAIENNFDREDWIKVGQAIHAATGGSGEGRQLFSDFAGRWSGGNTQDEINTAWASFRPHSITARTLYWYADQSDPSWRARVPGSKQEAWAAENDARQAATDAQAAVTALHAGKRGERQHPSPEWFRAMMDGVDDPDALRPDDDPDALQPDDDPNNDPPSSGGPSKSAGRRTVKWFHEYEDDPEIEYWDDSKLLPKIKGGSTVMALGRRGSHKTGVVSQMVLDAVLNHNATALYVACEDEQFFGKQRMPAYCKARGITPLDLQGRFGCVPDGINLTKADAAERFIADYTFLKPDFVIIDTLAQATPGVDSNSSYMGDLLAMSGPVGKIRKAFNCVVIIPCHPPEGNHRKVSGHSSIVDNTDTVLIVEYNRERDDTLIDVVVDRIKHGRVGTHLYYRVDPDSVPVPTLIPSDEAPVIAKTEPPKGNGDFEFAMKIRTRLAGRGNCSDWHSGITNNDLAEMLIPSAGDDIDRLRERPGEVAKMVKRLKNIQQQKVLPQKPSVFDDMTTYMQQKGTTGRATWRWFDPETDNVSDGQTVH